MATIISKEITDLDNYTDSWFKDLPDGLLYKNQNNLRNLIKGIASGYRDILLALDAQVNDLYSITSDNYFLDEFLNMYGLPNPIFETLDTNEQKAFAIATMKRVRYLSTKEDYEAFMALLGYNVTLYPINANILEYTTLDASFPITFSYGVSNKDKLTYWVYVEESDSTETDFYNIGDAFNLDFVASQNNLLNAKKILDYIKPEYIIFEYITLYTKNLYGL